VGTFPSRGTLKTGYLLPDEAGLEPGFLSPLSCSILAMGTREINGFLFALGAEGVIGNRCPII